MAIKNIREVKILICYTSDMKEEKETLKNFICGTFKQRIRDTWSISVNPFTMQDAGKPNDEDPVTQCKRNAKDSEIVVFIIGEKFGQEINGKPTVQHEFEAAKKADNNIMIYWKDTSKLAKIYKDFPMEPLKKDYEQFSRMPGIDLKHHHLEFLASMKSAAIEKSEWVRLFKTSDELTELTALVCVDIIEPLNKIAVANSKGVSVSEYKIYKEFWNNLNLDEPLIIFTEVGEPKRRDELEPSKNIHGAVGFARLRQELYDLGIETMIKSPSDYSEELKKSNMILDGSNIGNDLTRKVFERLKDEKKIVYENRQGEEYKRWIHDIVKDKIARETEYIDILKPLRKNGFLVRITRDFGIITRVSNPFDESKKSKILSCSGNHGAGTFACMKILTTPRYLTPLLLKENVKEEDFQVIVGIEVPDRWEDLDLRKKPNVWLVSGSLRRLTN